MTPRAVRRLERVIHSLTKPINGQYPRPWMTDADPVTANVFLIGRNWGVPFPVRAVGPHDRFLDAHFNRNGESCGRLYDEITNKRRTQTRKVYDRLIEVFNKHDVVDVLTTNVICYGTSGSAADLRKPEHRGGRERGIQIFRTLLETLKPPILIYHGVGTAKDLRKYFNCSVPQPTIEVRKPTAIRCEMAGYMPLVFGIPSLAFPAFNKWSSWAPKYFEALAKAANRELKTTQS